MFMPGNTCEFVLNESRKSAIHSKIFLKHTLCMDCGAWSSGLQALLEKQSVTVVVPTWLRQRG